jgi:hypothetical protein
MPEKSQKEYTRIGFDSIESAKAVRREVEEFLHEKDDARRKDVYLSSETPSEIVEKARRVAGSGGSNGGSSEGRSDGSNDSDTGSKKQEGSTTFGFSPYDPTENLL